MAYNTTHTRRKSTYLAQLDCGTTGTRYSVGATIGKEYTWRASVTTDEIIEQGECIAMVRIPANTEIIDAELTWTASATLAVVGVGDPFCCGRLLGPILVGVGSGSTEITPSGFTCAWVGKCIKIGTTGDGCGRGYVYTCETDLVLTNGYGERTFAVGGGAPGTSVGGPNSGTLPSGWVAHLVVRGIQR